MSTTATEAKTTEAKPIIVVKGCTHTHRSERAAKECEAYIAKHGGTYARPTEGTPRVNRRAERINKATDDILALFRTTSATKREAVATIVANIAR